MSRSRREGVSGAGDKPRETSREESGSDYIADSRSKATAAAHEAVAAVPTYGGDRVGGNGISHVEEVVEGAEGADTGGDQPGSGRTTDVGSVDLGFDTREGSLEWSERDERLLGWLRGPRGESFPNTPFRSSERDDLEVALQNFAERITEIQEFAAELKAVNATLDQMREDSERIGRKDWLLLGIGAVTALGLNAAFPPAVVVHGTKLFVHGVAHLFGEGLAG
jgi:hypothetical protein